MPLDNLIQRADLNQRLTRALEIKGQKSPVLQLDNTVQGVVLVEDLTRAAEWTSPTERRLMACHTIAGVAGQNAILAIQNPIGSGVVGVFDFINVRVDVGTSWTFGLVNPAGIPAGPANLFFRDRRVTGAPAIRAWQGTDAVLQIVNPYLEARSSATFPTTHYDLPDLVLQPGDSMGVQVVSVGAGMSPTIWLQEIPI